MDRDGNALPLEHRRDGQQWVLDYLIKVTGHEQNWEQWEPGERRYPPEIRSHDMIPRVMSRHGERKERMARAAEDAGHHHMAVKLYLAAVGDYRWAQHAIFRDDDPEKLYICGRLEACYDRVIALSPRPVERVDVPFEGGTLSGLLHRAPGDGPRPVVLFCPGMDMIKETFPTLDDNPYHDRGVHVLAIDGPGQGTANLRKIRVTDSNYERAAARFIDALVARDDVDAGRIAVSGRSFGSFWGMRVAATDDRVRAVATGVATYTSKREIFQKASPRFKQIFMYMAGHTDEGAFDEMAARMSLHDAAQAIACPTLMVTGEYDPLSPLAETVEVFEKVAGPKEMWVVEDAFHPLTPLPHFGGVSHDDFLADWIVDALDGRAPVEDGRKLLLGASGLGPYGDPVRGYHLGQRHP